MTVYTPPRFAGEAVKTFLDSESASREAGNALARQAFMGYADTLERERQYKSAEKIAKKYGQTVNVQDWRPVSNAIGELGTALVNRLFPGSTPQKSL